MAEPIIQDQYTAARVYFVAVVAILLLEGIPRLAIHLTALLRRNDVAKTAQHWPATVFIHRTLTRCLPMPFFNDYHIADLVRFLAFAGLNVIFSINNNRFTTDYKLYGWLTIANGGLALLFATRSNLFAIVLRLPSPVILQYHRWVGIATVAHATAHFGYNVMHYIETKQLATATSSLRIRVGIMAWASLAVMFLSALPIVRRRLFEAFYYTHFLFLVFIAGSLIHATHGPEFLLPGLCLWAVDRAVRFAYNFRKVRVERVAYYEGDLTKIEVTGIRAASPCQIVWIQIPGVSFFNWHPFTIASVSPPSASQPDARSMLAVRGLGGYTSAVQKLTGSAMESENTLPGEKMQLRIDGPYGVGRFNWHHQKLTVLVAGGVGVTPGLSIASSIIKARRVATEEHMSKQHIYLLWTVKDAAHLSWFAAELASLLSLCQNPESGVTLDITVHITGGTNKDAVTDIQMQPLQPCVSGPWTLKSGRPNLLEWFDKIKGACPGQDAAVNVCGPLSLIRDARRACVSKSTGSGLFYLEEEVFEL